MSRTTGMSRRQPDTRDHVMSSDENGQMPRPPRVIHPDAAKPLLQGGRRGSQSRAYSCDIHNSLLAPSAALDRASHVRSQDPTGQCTSPCWYLCPVWGHGRLFIQSHKPRVFLLLQTIQLQAQLRCPQTRPRPPFHPLLFCHLHAVVDALGTRRAPVPWSIVLA